MAPRLLLLAPRLCLPQLAARDGILSRVDHDGVIDWKHFPRYWPFVRGIHRSLVNSPHKVQWRGALTVFFDVHLYKRLSKLSIRPWFKTPSRSLWCHCNAMISMPYAIDACGHIYASVNLVIIGSGITVIRRSGHYNDVTWSSWHLKSPTIRLLHCVSFGYILPCICCNNI